MKVTLRCDQDRPHLDKADELYVPYKRIDLIEKIHTEYPDKGILLDVSDMEPTEEVIEELKMYSGLCRGKLKVLVNYDYYENISIIQRVLKYPMTSLYEMEIAYQKGIKDFYIGAELLHRLDKVLGFKNKYGDITIRAFANCASLGQEGGWSQSVAPIGNYILPQDLKLKELETIDYLQFKAESANQEATYYKLYITEHYWAGPIHMLIKDIESENVVRMMSPIAARFRCNTGCLSGSFCRLCYRNFSLADPALYNNLKKPEDSEKGEEV